MLCLLALTTVVVIFKVIKPLQVAIETFSTELKMLKVSVIDGSPDPNVTTFAPLAQLVNSNIKYNGNGYMPCNGYVPCQPVYLPIEKLEERMDGAMPCHNYKGQGDSPAGCW